MILLGSDRRLVAVKSWEEVTEINGYTECVDYNENKLKELLGQYTLKEKPKCGLKGCRTPHNRGYIAQFQDNSITNIGNVCGKKHFGVVFDQVKSTFQQEYNASEYRAEIAAFKNRIAAHENKIEFLRSGDKQGEYCISQIKPHSTRLYPQETLDRLHDRAKTKQGEIVRVRELSEKELESLPEGTPRFVETKIGSINGISALKNFKKLQTLLEVDLGSEISVFKTLNEESLEFKVLKRWYKWTTDVPKKISEAESIIEECNRFLLPSNVALIRENKKYL